MEKALNIFEFQDYRTFLKAWLEDAKKRKTSNLTRLAEVMSLHPTYLSHVLNGTKDLSAEQAFTVTEHLSLSKLEREYFFILLQIERAGTAKLKEYLLEKKKDLLKQKDQLSQRFKGHKELSDTERAIYYSNWTYAALAVATDIQGGQTLAELTEKFNLERRLIQEVLNFLVSLGIVVEKNGKFSLGQTHVHVPNESPFVVKHHINWRIKSMQRMEIRKPEELFLTSPMSISQKDFAAIREKLNKAIQEIIEVAKDSKSESVFCLNLDFFKVI
jgi:uncharacterized protein (TIGR02147 family)